MFAVAVIPAIALGVGMAYLLESPRWLASKGAWDRVDKEVGEFFTEPQKSQLINEAKQKLQMTENVTLRSLLRPGLRLALLLGIVLAVFQQLIGINTVIYYAPQILQFAGVTDTNSSIAATSFVGVVNVLATVASLFLIDAVGRRPLLLGAIAGCAAALAIMGTVFAIGSSSLGLLVLGCLIGYIVSFGVGIGGVFWMLGSEIYPTHMRGQADGLTATANWTANLLISVPFLSLVDLIGGSRTFWLYAIFAIAAFVFCWILVPETKGRSLEKIETYWESERKW